ncbi:hypothetical protein D9M69_374150 [compost metagenome]
MAMRQPSPGSPSTSAAAARAPSKNTSLNSAPPPICRIGRISMPGWSSGSIRKIRPLLPREPGSQRASTKIQSESCASEVHTFWPLTSQPPLAASRTARVRTLARSEPAPGSE